VQWGALAADPAKNTTSARKTPRRDLMGIGDQLASVTPPLCDRPTTPVGSEPARGNQDSGFHGRDFMCRDLLDSLPGRETLARLRQRFPGANQSFAMTKILCLAGAALAFLPGCISYADDGVHAVQWSDIRVPKGMKLSTHLHQSNTLEVGNYRYANLVYEGGRTPLQVASYLLETMPKHAYRLVSQEHVAGGEQLVFQRGPHTSTCTISNHERLTRLEIRVRTHPKL
jgi:hypothetical protein